MALLLHVRLVIWSASVWLACNLHQIWGNVRVLLIDYAAVKGGLTCNALLKRARLIDQR